MISYINRSSHFFLTVNSLQNNSLKILCTVSLKFVLKLKNI